MELHPRIRVIAYVLVASLSMPGCASIGLTSRSTLELGQDAVVTVQGLDPVGKKKGDQVEVRDAPILVEARGRIPMLVIPETKSPSKFKLALRPVESSSGNKLGASSDDSMDDPLNAALDELVDQVNEVQQLLGSRKPGEALAKVESLQIKYPRVALLRFLRASCFVVMGDRARARSLLQQALVEFPNHPRAHEMMRTLSGGTSREDGRIPASEEKARKRSAEQGERQ